MGGDNLSFWSEELKLDESGGAYGAYSVEIIIVRRSRFSGSLCGFFCPCKLGELCLSKYGATGGASLFLVARARRTNWKIGKAW